MPYLYYTDQKPTIEFFVETARRRLAPKSTTVAIYKEGEEIVPQTICQVEGNKVSFDVPKEAMGTQGEYLAIFQVELAGARTPQLHHVSFAVVPREPPTVTNRTPVKELHTNSTDFEVETAVSQAIRQLRRSGLSKKKALEAIYEAAQGATGRYIHK